MVDLGSDGEQHILEAAIATSANRNTKQAGNLLHSAWLETGIQVAQKNCRANVHHHKQVLCHFEPSTLFYGRFSVQKRPFSSRFEGVFRTFVLKV